MPAAVDERLRFDGASGVGTFRFTTADFLGGTVIPATVILALSWHFTNRDSSHFPDADQLDLNRRPVVSLAFGHGSHYCIGVPDPGCPTATLSLRTAASPAASRLEGVSIDAAGNLL